MSNDIDNVTPKGVLLVVSGPSGAGKGTICQMLRDKLPDLGYSISVTTRAPRTGEVDGESYFFKTIPEVKQMIEKEKSKYGWEFLFLGANINAVETAKNFGIGSDRAVNYHSDHEGTQLNYEVVSEAICSVRCSRPLGKAWKQRIDEDYESRKK